MAQATISVQEETLNTLEQLARQEGQPVESVLAEAVEAYRRQRFLEHANAAFARLREDPQAWQDELDERKMWDTTLSDGVGEE